MFSIIDREKTKTFLKNIQIRSKFYPFHFFIYVCIYNFQDKNIDVPMKKKHTINRALVPKESKQSIHLNIVILCPVVPGPVPGGGCPTLHMDRIASKALCLDVDGSFILNTEACLV